MKWCLIVISIYINLIINDVKHYFVCLLAIGISFLQKYKIYPFECRVPKNSTESKSLSQYSEIEKCTEIEENNSMGKTSDIFKKIRDTRGTFHAKMGTINYKNGMDLTEAEDIKKRWQKYTEELYKKDLHDPNSHDGVITHLEPDILE